MDIITTKQMLAQMEAGVIFSMTVVSYDRQRKKKTGRILEFQEAKLYKADRIPSKGKRPATQLEQNKAKLEALKSNPNHRQHYTRNIVLMVNGVESSQMRKIHPPLVLTFNNKKAVP